MTILLSGGSKSGKSDFAQELALTLAKGGPHYYVATMIPGDQEDHARIRSHLARRAGMGFETVECGRHILSCLERADKGGAFLLDSVTALLSNELFPKERGYALDEAAGERCQWELIAFAGEVENAVFVTDAIFCDAGRYDPVTEAYRFRLGAIGCALAAACDTVIEMSAGNLNIYKGRLPL